MKQDNCYLRSWNSPAPLCSHKGGGHTPEQRCPARTNRMQHSLGPGAVPRGGLLLWCIRQKGERLRKMTQPGSMRVRHSRPAFLAHLAPFSRPQRISSIWWNKVNSNGSSNADAHWGTPSTLWEPHSLLAGPPSAMSHHPFGLGWAKKLQEFVTSFLGGTPRLPAQGC